MKKDIEIAIRCVKRVSPRERGQKANGAGRNTWGNAARGLEHPGAAGTGHNDRPRVRTG